MIYKAWLESRVWFLLGFVWLTIYVFVLITRFPSESRREKTESSVQYECYIQTAWFGTMPLSWVFMATMVGSCGIGKETSSGTAPFVFSLPVTRRRLLETKAAVGAAEITVLAVVPSLLISTLSPFVGREYPISEALMRSVLVVVGGMVFFSLSFLQATILRHEWPTLVGCVCLVLVNWGVRSIPGFDRLALFPILSKESYLNGDWAWIALGLSVTLSAAMAYLSLLIVENGDY